MGLIGIGQRKLGVAQRWVGEAVGELLDRRLVLGAQRDAEAIGDLTQLRGRRAQKVVVVDDYPGMAGGRLQQWQVVGQPQQVALVGRELAAQA